MRSYIAVILALAFAVSAVTFTHPIACAQTGDPDEFRPEDLPGDCGSLPVAERKKCAQDFCKKQILEEKDPKKWHPYCVAQFERDKHKKKNGSSARKTDDDVIKDVLSAGGKGGPKPDDEADDGRVKQLDDEVVPTPNKGKEGTGSFGAVTPR